MDSWICDLKPELTVHLAVEVLKRGKQVKKPWTKIAIRN